MASATDWRRSLTASQRYDNVQKIQRALARAGSTQSAFALENSAFAASGSLEQYQAACDQACDAAAAPASSTPESPPTDETAAESPTGASGERIGSYRDCVYVASGVTAEVYRCRDRALKVVVETRPLEPHNPVREAKILGLLRPPCIPLLDTFRDQAQRFVLVFPYMPLSLDRLLAARKPLPTAQIRSVATDLFRALRHVHGLGIVHRDVKPSALLLASPQGPAYLSDFGAAWHPALSAATEPPDGKILDIGTGPYRAPEVLFGNKAYGPPVDLWGAGALLAECCRRPSPRPLFESRPAHEDGNQLGLILSIFKTLGTPTPETWPEAASFKTPPFEMYRVFEGKPWEEILPDVPPDWRALVAALVVYESGQRATADEALRFACLAGPDGASTEAPGS